MAGKRSKRSLFLPSSTVKSTRKRFAAEIDQAITIADLKTLGIAPRASVPGNSYPSLIELENNGGNEYWLGFNNFWSLPAITAV
jgi:hypothetical protein